MENYEDLDEVEATWEMTQEAMEENRRNTIAELDQQRAAVDSEKRSLLSRQVGLMIQELTRLQQSPGHLNFRDIVSAAIQLSLNETAEEAEALKDREMYCGKPHCGI